MKTALIAVVLWLVAGLGPADAARHRGEWSNAFEGTVANVTFVGRRLQPGQTTIQGRLRCRRCPIRGRLRLECVAQDPTTAECSGTIANGCTVTGYYYATHFEGVYDCGGNPVGSVSFGPR